MWIYEHILARHYSWSLKDIRQMDLQDFYIHLRICLVREEVEREFQAKLAGATFGPETAANSETEQVTKRVRHKSGAVTETKTQHNMLRNEVGNMRIDKRTGKVVSFNQPELSENDV